MESNNRPKLVRITTVPIALKYLLAGQMKFMQANGFDVIMISADGEGREDVIRQEGCEHLIIPMTRKITPFADSKSLWKLYRFFRKYKPDIIHSHTPKAGLLAMIAGKLAGVKNRIHTVAGLRFMTETGTKRKLLVAMEKLTARFATHVWPNSFSILKYIEENRLVHYKKLEVIAGGSSNGINLERFSADSLKPEHLSEVKKLINYDKDLVYLLCVGRIVKDKGINELVSAFEKLYAGNKKLRLIMVGSFEDELDPVSEKTRRILKENPGIIQTGWREDVEYFMHLAYALVHPSYREGFPNVLIQAGAMNCPVICSKIAGNIDIIRNIETGLIFEPQDEKSLFDTLTTALSDPASLKTYALNLRRQIEEKFDQHVVHQSLLKRYLELLS
jgi:glycosyltransferase involved in cell wall biosynthesis